MILKKEPKTYNLENKDLQIEIEIKSLDSFIRSAASCDTNVIDMLFCPNDMTLINTPTWSLIKKYRQDLICKNMNGLIGYIKTHAKKYGHKIERYKEMSALISLMNQYSSTIKINQTTLVDRIKKQNFKYIKISRNDDHDYIDVCGKKHITVRTIEEVKWVVHKEVQRYGSRTKEGNAKDGDWKSLSHAVRVLYEVIEIVETQNLVFPLKDANTIKEIKLGLVPQEEVINLIDDLFEKATTLIEQSDLKEDVVIDNMLRVAATSINERYTEKYKLV